MEKYISFLSYLKLCNPVQASFFTHYLFNRLYNCFSHLLMYSRLANVVVLVQTWTKKKLSLIPVTVVLNNAKYIVLLPSFLLLALLLSLFLPEHTFCWWSWGLTTESDWFWVCALVSNGQCSIADALLHTAVRCTWTLPQLRIWQGVWPVEPWSDPGVFLFC